MLSTPTAGINMQNRTARLISLARSVGGFSVVGFLPPPSDGMRDRKNPPTRHGADIHTSEFLGGRLAMTGQIRLRYVEVTPSSLHHMLFCPLSSS